MTVGLPASPRSGLVASSAQLGLCAKAGRTANAMPKRMPIEMIRNRMESPLRPGSETGHDRIMRNEGARDGIACSVGTHAALSRGLRGASKNRGPVGTLRDTLNAFRRRWHGRGHRQRPLPPTDIAPRVQLVADVAIDADGLEPQTLVKGDAGRIG